MSPLEWILIVFAGLLALAILVAIVGSMLPGEHRISSALPVTVDAAATWEAIRSAHEEHSVRNNHGRIVDVSPDRMVIELDGANGREPETHTYEVRTSPGGSMVIVTRRRETANPFRRVIWRARSASDRRILANRLRELGLDSSSPPRSDTG